MSAYSFVAEKTADKSKLLLNRSGGERKQQFISADAVTQAIVFNILVYDKRNRKNSLFPCFLFRDGKMVAPAVTDNVREPEMQNIANP